MQPASSSNVRLWQGVFALLGLGFVALVVWASLSANFGESFAAIAEDPWGIVSLTDLYFGFVLFIALVFLADGVRPAAFIWAVAIVLLGNAVAALWLILRLPSLVRRLRTDTA